MKREVNLSDISDGKLYSSNDMVRADCQGCNGCFACCCGMGSSVVLDPLDVDRLAKYLKLSSRQLLGGPVALGGGGRTGSAAFEHGRRRGEVSFPWGRWPVQGLHSQTRDLPDLSPGTVL